MQPPVTYFVCLYFSENYLNKAQVCCMLAFGMLGNATLKKIKNSRSQTNRTRIITWLICRQAKWSAHVFLFWACNIRTQIDDDDDDQDDVPIARHCRAIECLQSMSTKFGNCCSYFGEPGGGPYCQRARLVKGVCCSRGPLATPCHFLRMLSRRGEVHFKLG